MSFFEIQGLRMYYATSRGMVKAIRGVDLKVDKGQSMGLAGESGCGKTSVGLSILRLLPDNAHIMEGRILFHEKDLLRKSEDEMRRIRWKHIAMIFQSAMNALNPVYRVGDQIVEAILAHEEVTKDEAKDRVSKLFELVGLDPERADQYPHEYSGGMRQRAIIAMALACNPELLIADEPTTALDVIHQKQIIEKIDELRQKLGMTMVYITHDIAIISETCDAMAVMYGGKVVESSRVRKLIDRPMHPYTQGLIRSIPSLHDPMGRLASIEGEPPNLLSPPEGCSFHPRCGYSKEICRRIEPPLRQVNGEHLVACHFAEEIPWP